MVVAVDERALRRQGIDRLLDVGGGVEVDLLLLLLLYSATGDTLLGDARVSSSM